MTQKTTSPNLHSFFEATLDVDRLKIISVLSQEPISVLAIAEKIGQNPSVVLRHLGLLEEANLVKSLLLGDRIFYQFNQKNLDLMKRREFSELQSQVDLSSLSLSEKQRVIIKNYTLPDGTLKRIPSQSKKIIAILEYVCQAFEVGRLYSEKEVSVKLNHFYSDTTSLRRYLVDYGYMGRESNGTSYWRLDNRK